MTKEYQELFVADDIDLRSEEEALKEIAKEALGRHSDARGLRSIMEDIMYDAPGHKNKVCTITVDTVHNKIPVYTDAVDVA